MNTMTAVAVLIIDILIYVGVMVLIDEVLEKRNKTKFFWYCFIMVLLVSIVYFIPPSEHIKHLIYKIGFPIIPGFFIGFLMGFFLMMSAGEQSGSIVNILFVIIAIIAPFVVWVIISVSGLMAIAEKVVH